MSPPSCLPSPRPLTHPLTHPLTRPFTAPSAAPAAPGDRLTENRKVRGRFVSGARHLFGSMHGGHVCVHRLAGSIGLRMVTPGPPPPFQPPCHRALARHQISGTYLIVTSEYSASTDAYEVSGFDSKSGTTYKLTVGADEVGGPWLVAADPQWLPPMVACASCACGSGSGASLRQVATIVPDAVATGSRSVIQLALIDKCVAHGLCLCEGAPHACCLCFRQLA